MKRFLIIVLIIGVIVGTLIIYLLKTDNNDSLYWKMSNDIEVSTLEFEEDEFSDELVHVIMQPFALRDTLTNSVVIFPIGSEINNISTGQLLVTEQEISVVKSLSIFPESESFDEIFEITKPGESKIKIKFEWSGLLSFNVDKLDDTKEIDGVIYRDFSADISLRDIDFAYYTAPGGSISEIIIDEEGIWVNEELIQQIGLHKFFLRENASIWYKAELEV